MHLKIDNVKMEHGKFSLKDINIDLTAGDTVAICGKIGSGKTSLLRVLGLLDRPKMGHIYIDSTVNCTSLPQAEIDLLISRYFAYVFQEFDLMETWTAIENIALPLMVKGYSKEHREKQAKYYCEQLGIAKYATQQVSTLSGGTRKLVTVGRALAKKPKILIADEPIASLDPNFRKRVVRFLSRIAEEENMIIIAAAHLDEIKSNFKKQYNIEDDTLKLVRNKRNIRKRRGKI
ncbi:ATP-binding cassette domain-containing protein [Thiotrichales bacterium HSG1]|nr:ATP-binding cassette domain-containing protein [Thiotrichales bacterium HSG1]